MFYYYYTSFTLYDILLYYAKEYANCQLFCLVTKKSQLPNIGK